MTIKKKSRLILKCLCLFAILYLLFVIAFNRCTPNINGIYEFDNISDFQKKTGLKFYDLYDFDSYVNDNQKVQLRDENIHLSFDEEYPNQYMIMIPSSKIQYKVELQLSENLTDRDYKTEKINGATLYGYTYNDGESSSFIIRDGRIQYVIEEVNGHHFPELFEKVKEYVKINQEFHSQK